MFTVLSSIRLCLQFSRILKSDTSDQSFQKAIGRFLQDSMSFFIELTSVQFMFHAYCMNAWILKARSEPQKSFEILREIYAT
jgi:hypothetical protein